ncbi:MAG TPA: hypothetical protein VGN12_02320 [Pirellulales bacterium]
MPQAPEHTHRWFRFSLATMFVVVTMVGLFLGWRAWCLDWIQQRWDVMDERCMDYVSGVGGDGYPKAPFMLRMFGEQGCDKLTVAFFNADPDAALTPKQQREFLRIKGLFPEATDLRTTIVDPDLRDLIYHDDESRRRRAPSAVDYLITRTEGLFVVHLACNFECPSST